MKNRILSFLFIFLWALTVGLPAFAGDLVVTRYFSGLWDQTKHESQGIVLQIIDQEDLDGDPKAVAYWFTYGDDLQTAWYVAIGEVEGDQVLMDLFVAYNVGFLEDDSLEMNPVEAVGTLNLTFKNCNKGMAEYFFENTDMGGEFEISRLASIYNSRCSGGISDNTPSDAKPVMLEVELLPPSDDMTGKGKAKFWERTDRMDFHVSAEEIPDGEYDIRYCDEVYGPLTVVGGEGATQFRSPEAIGQILLIEDPRDCRIEITQGEDPYTVYLTSGENVLGEKEKGPGDKVDKTKVELELVNTGVEGYESAEGEVEYEVDEDETEFEVEVKGLDIGTYGFFVAGTWYGDLVVAVDGEKTKLKFSDPQKTGEEMLNFVPWDAMIEVRNDSNVPILEGAFPSP